jgi:hypothetical protein
MNAIRVAYADPPYLGYAKYYGDPETDHAALIRRLVAEYPDGWALSCHSPSLRVLLPLCPEDARVLAWVKPFASFKPNVRLAYAWEPVILRGGRRRSRRQPTVRDWLAASCTLKRNFIGAKPDAFACWLFEALGLHPADTFDDLFPGSGAVSRAWERWRGQIRLPAGDFPAGTRRGGELFPPEDVSAHSLAPSPDGRR